MGYTKQNFYRYHVFKSHTMHVIQWWHQTRICSLLYVYVQKLVSIIPFLPFPFFSHFLLPSPYQTSWAVANPQPLRASPPWLKRPSLPFSPSPSFSLFPLVFFPVIHFSSQNFHVLWSVKVFTFQVLFFVVLLCWVIQAAVSSLWGFFFVGFVLCLVLGRD